MSALNIQEGGNHYTKLSIQPMEYSMANKLDACQHTAIKYITRFRDKNGKQDLLKAIHVIQMLIEFEYGKESELDNLVEMSQEIESQIKEWPVEQHGLPTNMVEQKEEFIDWSDLREWVQWVAKDIDGRVWCFSHKPVLSSKSGRWNLANRDIRNRGGYHCFAYWLKTTKIPGDWKQSLRKRPK